jgi:predicted RNA binding protein YcfA (HicA-like mRNA interferase family)
MGIRFPKLKLREVEANLKSLGFVLVKTVGSHRQYVREPDGVRLTVRAKVTVDAGKDQFDSYLMKMMIRQSLLTKEEFCTGILKISPVQPKAVTKGGKNA